MNPTMVLTLVTLTLTLLVSLRVEGSQNAKEVLNTGSHDQVKESPLQRDKRNTNTDSSDYISYLWSNIENAIKFLEQQAAQSPTKEKLKLQDLQRTRKNEKISKLPFTQHNFIRFGKRFVSPRGAAFPPFGTASTSQRQEILDRILNKSNLQVDKEFLENGSQGNTRDLQEIGSIPEKRQYHNFVRIGKRFLESADPLETAGDFTSGTPEIDSQLFRKRPYSNFVRFGKRLVESADPLETAGDFTSGTPEIDSQLFRKRPYSNFVRFGKRLVESSEPQEIAGDFTSGTPEIDSQLFRKRPYSNFVRFG